MNILQRPRGNPPCGVIPEQKTFNKFVEALFINTSRVYLMPCERKEFYALHFGAHNSGSHENTARKKCFENRTNRMVAIIVNYFLFILNPKKLR